MDKILYKLCIFAVKTFPTLSALCYLIGTIFSLLNIDLIFLSYLGFTSIFSWLILYITSFAFKFCIWHRMPLYYIIANNILNYIDYIFLNPIPINIFIIIHLIVAGIFFTISAVLKYKSNERTRNT